MTALQQLQSVRAIEPLPQHGLVGFSGARITLHRRHGRVIVRKTAGTPAQNDRLRRQGAKQARFHAAGVDTPRVLGAGDAAGLVYFEMDYVPAPSIAATICRGDAGPCRRLTPFLTAWFESRRREVTGVIQPEQLLAKLRSVLAASAANPSLGPSRARLPTIAARLMALAWPGLPDSPGHGDFTTENMLGGPGERLVLIDFDTPEMESFCLDIAKLYQDLAGHWCLRRLAVDGAAAATYREAVRVLSDLRAAVDHQLAQMLPELLPELPALVCLNLMRALPYSSTQSDCAFILDRVEALLPSCREAAASP